MLSQSSLQKLGLRQWLARTGAKHRFISSLAGASDFEGDEIVDDLIAQRKDDALRCAIARLEGEFNPESMLSMKSFFSLRRAPVISTGSLTLDRALGIGGLPRGRIVEIYGREASGKTTLALHIIKEAQKLGGYCAFLDAENALDSSMAESLGVNLENLLIAPPNSAENMLSMVDILTKSDSVDVIVIDSVAALIPKREIDDPMLSCHASIHSRVLSLALRRIHHTISRTKTLLVLLNQVRYSSKSSPLGVQPAKEATSGGNALKFYTAVRLRMSRTGLFKDKNEFEGVEVCVQVVKNKLAPINDKADLKIKFGKGCCVGEEVFRLACEYGMIVKQEFRYSVNGQLFADESSAIRYLSSNKHVLDNMFSTLRSEMFA